MGGGVRAGYAAGMAFKAGLAGLAAMLLLGACSTSTLPKPVPFSPSPSAPVLKGASLGATAPGRIGYYLGVTGSGFNPADTLKANLQIGGKVTSLGSLATRPDGSFATQLYLPKGLVAGMATLEVCEYAPHTNAVVGCVSTQAQLTR